MMTAAARPMLEQRACANWIEMEFTVGATLPNEENSGHLQTFQMLYWVSFDMTAPTRVALPKVH
jgi:hypothetical protein